MDPVKKEKKESRWTRDIIEVVLAFFIAWLAYQVLALAMGTSMPIVSVVSDSMYHTAYFDKWWDANSQFYAKYGINKDTFKQFTDVNGLSRGDLLLVTRAPDPKIGDILIYKKYGSDFTIVHRLIEKSQNYYMVKGDNNAVPDPPVAKEYVIGKVVFAVPILGYPRLLLHLIGI